MFNNRDIVCAVEIGTSKICVLVGEVSVDGEVEVIGRGLVPGNGSVVKGEICNYPGLLPLLEKAIDEADRSSGGCIGDCRLVQVLVTGCGIASQQGVGSAAVRNEERVVTELERQEALENAQVLNLAADREILNCSETFFKVDGRRVSNPMQQRAAKLETHVHVVHGIGARLDAFRRAVSDAGFGDVRTEVTFSVLADDFALLTDEEREQGVLLVDLGAGCTEYIVEYDRGICASGVIQLGMEHVANDLSVAMNLNIELCRKLLRDGTLARKREKNSEYLDFQGAGGYIRRIPLASFETVIDWRLREIFEIIRAQLLESGAPHSLDAGGALTGGGASFYRSEELFSKVFELDCRKRVPADVGGILTGLDDPRFSTVWGGLKLAAHFLGQLNDERKVFDSLVDGLNRGLDNVRKGLKNMKTALKI